MRFNEKSHLYNIKAQSKAASADVEAAVSWLHETADFQCRQNSLISEEMPSRTFITREKSVSGFKASLIRD